MLNKTTRTILKFQLLFIISSLFLTQLLFKTECKNAAVDLCFKIWHVTQSSQNMIDLNEIRTKEMSFNDVLIKSVKWYSPPLIVHVFILLFISISSILLISKMISTRNEIVLIYLLFIFLCAILCFFTLYKNILIDIIGIHILLVENLFFLVFRDISGSHLHYL